MKSSSPAGLALAIVLGTQAPLAQALNFVYRDVGATTMTAPQLAAFQVAGDFWEGVLFDPVTVYLDIQLAPLGPGILGGADSADGTASYSSVRSQLVTDAISAADATAIAHLQPAPALSFTRTTDSSRNSVFDGNAGLNNTRLRLTTANAKALGYDPGTSADFADGNITFSSTFNFDYDRSTPGPAGSYDFVSVAMHEIGHILGFVSRVDVVDEGLSAGRWAANPGGLENDVFLSTLDLYRYSAQGVLDFRVAGSPYFSIDGGATSNASFSTGRLLGNGSQASHFAPGSPNLMRPAIAAGQILAASPVDLMVFDVIGWNLTAAVPEPEAWALLLAGLGVVGARARRHG